MRPRTITGNGNQILARDLAIFIDELDLRIGEHHGVRCPVQRIHTPPDELRMILIIMGHPLEVLRTGQFEHAVVVGSGADIRFISIVTNSLVHSGVFLANRARVIRRGIVGDDQLEVLKILVQDGVNGLPDVLLSIEDRKPYANQGYPRHQKAAFRA
jgi:hypothetical protein